MAYQRKTRDEYEIHEYVPGYGWEYSTSEETWEDAKKQKKCYEENDISAKIVKKRVPVTQ